MLMLDIVERGFSTGVDKLIANIRGDLFPSFAELGLNRAWSICQSLSSHWLKGLTNQLCFIEGCNCKTEHFEFLGGHEPPMLRQPQVDCSSQRSHLAGEGSMHHVWAGTRFPDPYGEEAIHHLGSGT